MRHCILPAFTPPSPDVPVQQDPQITANRAWARHVCYRTPSYVFYRESLQCIAGYNDVLDDESMGWARYAHSIRVFVFNSGLFYMRPTPAALDLLDRLVRRVETENGWDQAIFNEVRDPGHTATLQLLLGLLSYEYMIRFGLSALMVTKRNDIVPLFSVVWDNGKLPATMYRPF